MEPPYPPHFEKGSLIQLGDGRLKLVEEMKTEDFMKSADSSDEIQMDSSIVTKMLPIPDKNLVMLGFLVGEQKIEVNVESTYEHPFFVFQRGWSSFSPEKTLQRYKLQCHQLRLGDKIVSLTQKDLSLTNSGNTSGLANTNVPLVANNSINSALPR